MNGCFAALYDRVGPGETLIRDLSLAETSGSRARRLFPRDRKPVAPPEWIGS